MMRHNMPGCSAATLTLRKPLPTPETIGHDAGTPVRHHHRSPYRRSRDRTVPIRSVTLGYPQPPREHDVQEHRASTRR